MTLVIGIGNRARHGKDTAGEAIVDYYARRAEMSYKHGQVSSKFVKAKIYKWADALYAEVNAWLGEESGKFWLSGRTDIHYGLYAPWQKGQIAVLPDWVRPTPNAEILSIAPFGKHAKLLQWWGTEYRRTQDSDYWVNTLVGRITRENPDIALITDTRFKNEAQAVKDLGGYTLNVSRKNANGSPYVDPSRPADHPSETDLDDWNWDLKIINSYGHAALTGELAITYVEYLRGLRS